MHEPRPPEIKAQHLSRKAVVYVRQSTEVQVRHNVGSTEYQKSLQMHAQRWGWPAERIEVIETDLGLSGTGTEDRHGYQLLLADIRANRVGLLLVSSVSRLGRNAVEGLTLLNTMVLHDVLLAVDGRIADVRDHSDLLLTQIQAVVAEHDNNACRAASRQGALATARRGYAISRPPCGYVSGRNATWLMDPDEAVRVGRSARCFGHSSANGRCGAPSSRSTRRE